jgi:penicillin-binding protein 1A
VNTGTLEIAAGGTGSTINGVFTHGSGAVLRLNGNAGHSVLTVANGFDNGGVIELTGTSWGGRDAWAMGFDAAHVVGVWVGNDDNTPLNGITGGGIPARIWKDFMSGALAIKPTLRATSRPDPQGPVQQLDLPDSATIPLGDDGSQLRIDRQGVTVSGEVQGVPMDLRVDQGGVVIQPNPSPTP